MDNGISLQTKGTYSSVQGKLNLIQSTDSYLLYISSTWLKCIERWWLQQTVLEESEKGEFKWVLIFVRNASWQKKESSTFIYK